VLQVIFRDAGLSLDGFFPFLWKLAELLSRGGLLESRRPRELTGGYFPWTDISPLVFLVSPSDGGSLFFRGVVSLRQLP